HRRHTPSEEASMMSLGRPLLLSFFLVLLGSSDANRAAPPVEQQSAKPQTTQQVDQYGDPLPPGARARLGTVRLQSGEPIFSPDGKLLATLEYNDGSVVCLWDYDTGKLVRRFMSQQGRIDRIAFSPNGDWLAAAGVAPAIQLWKVATGKSHDSLTSVPTFPTS